jgi:hypothetical protein
VLFSVGVKVGFSLQEMKADGGVSEQVYEENI